MTIRILHVVVQPVLVDDDGETLTPISPEPAQALTAAQLLDFATTLPARVAALNTVEEATDG
ncbi:hypothetical protein B0I12_002574 [Microbacterium hydrothermale]|uniref:hypothetical protein n=1 Tax=Microbacterium hydrothermale TaxID=857427 RepID=UPI002226E464|nr:hypothetical protein [Microbacterium hydrothermale]MCW2165419.1 hypothetical protein [Microbacterium hydrothermale]